MDAARLLLLETSGRRGQVALAEGATLLAVRDLDEARRNARDLAPAVADLLRTAQWRPRDVTAVAVSIGPGSYTGLRVGVMSAKTFAYATRCLLLGIPTFNIVARQAPADVTALDVLADAQKENVYVQSFRGGGAGELSIRPFADWLAGRTAEAWVTGPGLMRWRAQLPAEVPVVAEALWEPRVEALLPLALERLAAGSSDNVLSLEPLYLRPSSAEEQWRGRAPC